MCDGRRRRRRRRVSSVALTILHIPDFVASIAALGKVFGVSLDGDSTELPPPMSLALQYFTEHGNRKGREIGDGL